MDKTIMGAVDSGNRLEILAALQRKIAEAIDSSISGKDIAALSKQLRETIKEIDQLKNESEPATKKTVLELVRNKRKKEA